MNELIARESGVVANAITSNTRLIQAAIIHAVRMIADINDASEMGTAGTR